MDQADQSSVTAFGLLFLVVMGVLAFRLSRRYAVMALLFTTAYMPLGQQFVVAGIHFQFFRILLLAGIVRVLVRRELSDMVLSPLDKVFIWWVIAGIVLGTMAEFGWDRFANRLGEAFNALVAYFLFRCWVRSLEDIIQTSRLLAMMIIPIALSMIVEKFTSHNIFSIFGGVPSITTVREGSLRCQAAFRHPILAGTYAATLFPLFVGLYFQQRFPKWLCIGGMAGALVATVAASTSGALLALFSEIIGLLLWSMRSRMRVIRWGIVITLALLAMVMKAPIWYLPSKISDVMGGTGWHRSYLMDQAIKHFDEWWMVGSTVTAHWAPAGLTILGVDSKNMDITNNYIAEGLGGGVIKLGLFIAMIVISFKAVGRWTKTPDASPYSRRMFVWCMGLILLGHSMSFLSVAYFDQIVVMWYWLLAGMSMLSLIRERSWNMMPPETVSHPTFGEPVGAEQG